MSYLYIIGHSRTISAHVPWHLGLYINSKIKVSSGPIGYSYSYRLLAFKESILHLWCPLSLRYLMIQVKWNPEEVHPLGIFIFVFPCLRL